jgi:hypothetical protein
MPTIIACILSGLGALFVWGVIGFALSRRIVPTTLALAVAPTLGWACHSALALPVYQFAGLTRWTVAAAFLIPLVAAAISLTVRCDAKDQDGASRVPVLAYGLAVLLAVIPALALFPKFHGDAITLAAPIFDHSKIALIDDIARLGVPPGNPFFGESEREPDLAYYYLWHFSAAELAVVFAITGWEADIALTGFTAFTSLILMSGLAVWISNCAGAGLFVVPLAFAASLHPVLESLLGPNVFYSIFLPPTGLAGWLFQTTWAPQHIAAASCILLACFLLTRLAESPSVLLAVVLALVVAAAYESSVWIGGILFGLVAPVLAALLLAACPSAARKRVAALFGVAAVLAFALACPFVKAQFAVAAERQVTHPIAVSPYQVFNVWIPGDWRAILNIPGYWLAFLFIEIPAVYIPGLVSLVTSVRAVALAPPVREATKAFAVLTIMSLVVTGYLTNTFADNNDLGWRAVLPGVFVLIIFAATGLSRWLATPRPIAAAGALLLFALSLPKSIQLLMENARGSPSQSGLTFGQTPAMWEAVRRYAAQDERVANNPLFMAEMTPWPVNISWALFADRPSCYAGHELAIAFAPLSRAREEDIGRQFERVFAGQPNSNDVRDFALRYACRVIVVTPQDGAWRRDPFAGSGYYELVEEQADHWRIYRLRGAPSPRKAGG